MKKQEISILKKLGHYVKTSFKLEEIFPYVLTLITSFFIVYIPIVRVVSMGNLGFEIPKVWAIEQLFTLQATTIMLYLFLNIISKRKLPKLNISKTSIIIALITALIVSAIFIISTSLSPFPELAWKGNDLRQQGAQTHLLIFFATLITFLFIKQKHIKILLGAVYFSSSIQVLIGFNQILLLLNYVEQLFKGLFINGSFGQSNFFSYSVANCIIFTVFLAFSIKPTSLKNITILYILYILFIISLLTLFFSGSLWTWFSLTITFVLFIILYKSKNLISKYKLNFLNIRFMRLPSNQLLPKFLLLLITLFFFFLPFTGKIFLVNDFRANIWDSVYHILEGNPKRQSFGIGFDTLGKVFKQEKLLSGYYVDRAHNLFLDLWLNGGIILALSLVFYVLKIVQIWDIKNKFKSIIIILIIHWIVKSSIHEFSIFNLFEFLLFFSLVLKLHFINRHDPKQHHTVICST